MSDFLPGSEYVYKAAMQVVPVEMSYAEFSEKRPEFALLLNEVAALQARHYYPTFYGMAIYDKTFEEPDRPLESAIVILVPPEFEFCLPTLAGQKPEVMNITSVDSLKALTVLCWPCSSPDIKLDVMLTDDSISRLLPRFESSLYLFIPVIAISGDRVVCGGFWFDQRDYDCLHATSMSSMNFRAGCVYDDPALAASEVLKRRIGTDWPQAFRPWRDEATKDSLSVVVNMLDILPPPPKSSYEYDPEFWGDDAPTTAEDSPKKTGPAAGSNQTK